MRTNTLRLTPLLVTLGAGIAAAQDIAPPSPPPAVPQGPPPSTIPEKIGEPIVPGQSALPEGTPTTTELVAPESVAQDELAASRAIGKEVERPSGESVGEVSDILLDGSGVAQQVVVREAFVGLPGEPVIFQFSDIDWSDRGGALAVSQEAGTPIEGETSVQASSHLSLSDMIGKELVNRRGAEVGTIRDVVIGNDGRARLVVFQLVGTADLDEKLATVPFESVEPLAGADRYLADTVGEQGDPARFRYDTGG